MTTVGSLFTGYGGLDLAVEDFFGASTIWVSDLDPGASAVLDRRFPDVPNLGDVSSVDWAEVPRVDVLTGGFPCQDLSPAGRRVGMVGARSGLWSEMATAIDALRPEMVVIENVRGILSAKAHSDLEPCPVCLGNLNGKPALRALGAVLGELADLRYDAEWVGLRAADVGAPHGRFRVFITAHPRGEARPVGGRLRAGAEDRPRRAVRRSDDGRREADREPAPPAPRFGWGPYAPAVRRWESLTREAPTPTLDGKLDPVFVEWMQGLPAGHVTGVGVTRRQSLRLLGNGVVPQQAFEALRRLDEIAA